MCLQQPQLQQCVYSNYNYNNVSTATTITTMCPQQKQLQLYSSLFMTVVCIGKTPGENQLFALLTSAICMNVVPSSTMQVMMGQVLES